MDSRKWKFSSFNKKKVPLDIKKQNHRNEHPFTIRTKHKQLIFIPSMIVLSIIALIMILVFI